MNVDRHYADPALAALYDAQCAGRPDWAFYLPLVLGADAVLDVGCGTGDLLRQARAAGHPGRLVGLDPAAAMLDHARARADVEWVHGDLTTAAWDQAFDLVVMTGHTFQVLLTDDELCAALAAVHDALVAGGRLAFETRNPDARAWERWTGREPVTIDGPDGVPVACTQQLVAPLDAAGRVRFTQTYTRPGWPAPKQSTSTLRFVDADLLDARLAAAGLTVDDRYGDWDRSPLGAASPEIITVARRARPAAPTSQGS